MTNTQQELHNMTPAERAVYTLSLMQKKERNTTWAECEARRLRNHPVAQRKLRQWRINELVKEMDLDFLGALDVCRGEYFGLPGVYLIVDGGARHGALMALGLGDWPCKILIHENVKTNKDASRLFLRRNKMTPVSSYDRYAQGVIAEDYPQIQVEQLVHSCGLKTGAVPGVKTIAAVKALCDAYKLDKTGRALHCALVTIVGAWGETSHESFDGSIIAGLSLVIYEFGDALDLQSLEDKLSKLPHGGSFVIGEARGRKHTLNEPIRQAAANAIIKIYNTSRRTNKLALLD